MSAIQRARGLLQFLGEDKYLRDSRTETLTITNERFQIWINRSRYGYVIEITELVLLSIDFCPITHVHFLRGSTYIDQIRFDVKEFIKICSQNGKEVFFLVREYITPFELTAEQLINLIFKLL